MATLDHGDTSKSSNFGSTAQSDEEAHAWCAADGNSPRSATETSGSDPGVHNEDNGSTVGFAEMVAGLNLFGDNTDALGVSSLIREMQRNLLPDMDYLRRSVLGNIAPVPPAVESLPAVLGNGAFDRVRSVQLSGVESLIKTVQAQQALTIKPMLPIPNVFESILPALKELSAFTEMQRSAIASSAIQQIVARPGADLSDLLGVVPSPRMLTDILTTADLTKNLDLSSVLPNAFGFATFSTVAQAATAAQQAATQASEEDAEEAAVQAVLQVVGDELDQEVPPTPEQIAAFETLARLLVDLRPNLNERFTGKAWLVSLATNGTLITFVYLALAQPALLAALLTVASIVAGAKWVYDRASGLLLPPGMDGDENR